jgi:hypothetical protein
MEDIATVINNLPGGVVTALEMTQWIPLFIAATDVEKSVLDIVTKSLITPRMKEWDIKRDNSYRMFVDAVKNMLRHPDPVVSQAARDIMFIIEHYGKIAAMEYDAESAAIDDMFREFLRPELTAAIVTLNVAPLLGLLETDNSGFKEARAARVSEKAAMPSLRMKDARLKTDKYYRNIVMHLEYMVKSGRSSQDLTNFIAQLNALVKSYRVNLARNIASHHVNAGDNQHETEETNE